MKSFYWNELKERAVQLVFEGQYTLQKIAEELSISYVTLRNWIHEDEFQVRLEQMRARLAEELEGTAFIKKEQRVIALSTLASQAREEWEQHRYLLEQRPVPSGTLVNEKLNEGAANLFLRALNDIAKELGDRQTNVKLTGKIEHQQTVVVNLAPVPDTQQAKYLSTKIIPDIPDILDDVIDADAQAPVALLESPGGEPLDDESSDEEETF